MATNTLIQKLFASDETSVGEDSNAVSNRIQVEKFRATEAISAGATVSLDVSQTSNGLRAMCVAEADATDYIPVGIYASTDDAASGDFIDIVLRGIVEEALTKGDVVNIAAGDRLTMSTDGKLIKVDSYRTDLGDGTGTTTGAVTQSPHVVAIAMEAQSADSTSRVFVLKSW
tara:strand:- start:16259 stop:16774 length:516 start_codon:yes stop_codon:yes gene_type:complete